MKINSNNEFLRQLRNNITNERHKRDQLKIQYSEKDNYIQGLLDASYEFESYLAAKKKARNLKGKE